jgi:hypothetical protein
MKRLTYTVECGVDAGHIGIADLQFLKEKGASCDRSFLAKTGLLWDIMPGTYSFELIVYGTYRGRAEKLFGRITTNGTIYVGDLCYAFNQQIPKEDKAWIKFVDETDCLSGHNELFSAIDTGGDGKFKTVITLE